MRTWNVFSQTELLGTVTGKDYGEASENAIAKFGLDKVWRITVQN